MKKLLAIGLIVCLITIGLMGCKKEIKPALADEISFSDLLGKVPNLNQSIIFSLDEYRFDYAMSLTLIQIWNKKISFDIGYSPTVEALGLVSFKLINVKDYITFPILDLVTIEPFVYIGMNKIENFKEAGEFTKGIGIKLISIKF